VECDVIQTISKVQIIKRPKNIMDIYFLKQIFETTKGKTSIRMIAYANQTGFERRKCESM